MSTAIGPTLPSRTSLVYRALGTLSFMLCAAWAVWPQRPVAVQPVPAPGMVTGSAPSAPTTAAFDPSAFGAPIWVAAAAPPPEPAPAAPLPPLRLELVAIVRGDSGLRAVVFDPDTDRLYALAAGQSVGAGMIEEVTEDAIQFTDSAGTRTLALRAPEARR